MRGFFGFDLATLLCTGVCAASEFDGAWAGTYNSQPAALMPNGSYPETVNRFQLSLHDNNGTITGEFRRGDDRTAKAQPITNGKRFGDRACFDVVLGSKDMRWCVQATGSRIRGAWSAGPQGGRLSGGAGVGARLFRIEGSRID